MASRVLLAFILLFCLSHGEDTSGKHSPSPLTRPLFRGKDGALRLGVASLAPLESWDDFPPWRRFFNAWMTRVKGPFVSEKVDDKYYYNYGYRSTWLDANGTRWTKDTRKQFNISLPDTMLERIGATLGLNVSFSHVEVVFTGRRYLWPQPTAGFTRRKQPAGRKSPVILTNIELEEELAQRNSSVSSNVVSVFDDIIGEAFRYLQLTCFYVLHESMVQAWYIPASTRADHAAGVVFHDPCGARYYYYGRDDFCTTPYYDFNYTAFAYLGSVDVARADVLAKHVTATLDEKDFTTKEVNYRIKDGDVVRFMIMKEWNESYADPGPKCVGFEDTRPRLLHPIGSDLRIAIIGLSNAGKTTLFNLLAGADAAVSSNVFTTQQVVARRTKIPDDRFEWLAKQFPQATLRPSSITLVDTPALLDPFNNAPWKEDVYGALRGCDIVYHVIRAFKDSSLKQWDSDSCGVCTRRYDYGDDDDGYEPLKRSSAWQHEESCQAVSRIMRTYDKKALAKLRKNATDEDDLDAIATIEDNVRGYTDQYGRGLSEITTDKRVRYHDWTEKELAVLERLRLFTSKPIVYALNMDAEEFAMANSNESSLYKVRKYIKDDDRDALVLPFAGRVLRDEAKATLFDAGELSGADAILQKTIEDCQVGHFYTANEDLVAAWAIKLGTTVEEAIKLVDATLETGVTVIEAVSMRGVVEVGSVEKALSLGRVRRLRFEDAVEDGDLLLLTPGKLEEAVQEITDSMSVSVSAHDPTRLSAPIGEEGTAVSPGYYVSIAFNLLLVVGLLAALLSNRELVKRIRTWIDEQRRKREALLGAVRFYADNESVKF